MGAGALRIDSQVGGRHIAGTGMIMGMEFGAAPIENTVVFLAFATGMVGGSIAAPAALSARGSNLPPARGEVDHDEIGVGITQYFMPENMYASVVVNSVEISLRDVDFEKVAVTRSGMGLGLTVGREWWVSNQWGLGLAATARISIVDDGPAHPDPGSPGAILDPGDSLRTARIGLAMSATYN